MKLREKGKMHFTSYQPLSINITLKKNVLIKLELSITEETIYYLLNDIGTHDQ